MGDRKRVGFVIVAVVIIFLAFFVISPREQVNTRTDDSDRNGIIARLASVNLGPVVSGKEITQVCEDTREIIAVETLGNDRMTLSLNPGYAERGKINWVYGSEDVKDGSITFALGDRFDNLMKVAEKATLREFESTNSAIYFVSGSTGIKLEDGESAVKGLTSVNGAPVNIFRDGDGKVTKFEMIFNEGGSDRSNIAVGEKYNDPAFNAIDLSFSLIDSRGAPDIRIGGGCG